MDTVYEPSVIKDNPLPDSIPQTQSAASAIDNSTMQVSQPYSIPDSIIPRKVVAHETIGETLNTKSKKITADYSFTEQGSLDIGAYNPGVSGDVRISPDGITARDKAGNTTFSLDGDTGDATFAGKLVAGTEIVGSVILGSGETVLDEEGIVSTTNFLKAVTTHGITQTFTTTSFVDLTNSQQDFTLSRQTVILFSCNMPLFLTESVGNTGNGVVFLDIDGTIDNGAALFCFSGNNSEQSYGFTYPVLLRAGKHTVKLKAKLESISAGAPIFNVLEFRLDRIHLGS
jgi:hypothetical protein